MTAEELLQQIVDKSNKPANVTSDAGSVSERSLRELLELLQYVAKQEAAQEAARGLRFTKLVPPGAV